VKDKRIKVMVAKAGLDGHDRGAKVIAMALRDAGMEVIYTGLHQTIDQMVKTAIQESVDVIGLSIMSGAHHHICKKLMGRIKEEGLDDVHVVVGGVIPQQDMEKLMDIGVKRIFPGGTRFEKAASEIKALVKK